MFQFPFGTMHQLNLDWFLQQWQQLRQDWIDEEQHIEDSMQDVYDARDAAIQAKDDAVSAKNDAQTAKNAADADALKAEGFAVGEQNGTPAGPGDPYYQSNAKFYSIEAGTYRYLSEAYARGTMGGTPVDPGDAGYEDNAKYYKDAAAASAQDASDDADYVRDHVTDADASALEAEGFAVGEQNGTPVTSGSPYYENNAKYYAGEAQQDKLDTDTLKDAANAAALRSEGYAVGKQNGTSVGVGSPYYENNAEYYASLAAAGSGISLAALPFFDDFGYTDDGTFSTAANQQQVVFTKNHLDLTRLGGGTTYYCMNLFGNHAVTSGNPPTFREDDLIPIPDAYSYGDLDIHIITKVSGHTTTETSPPVMYVATYDSDTQTWKSVGEALVPTSVTKSVRIFSLRKFLPEAFANKNFTVVLRVRHGATMKIDYSIIWQQNYSTSP